MREADLDLLLENFRAIADERMADLIVTPDLKARVMRAALETPQKSRKIRFFPKNRVVWGSVAVAAALLVAAIGGSRILQGGTSAAPQEAAAESPSIAYDFQERAVEEETQEEPVKGFAMPDEGESPVMSAPLPAPEAAPMPVDDSADGNGSSAGSSGGAGQQKDAAAEAEEESDAAVEKGVGDGLNEADGLGFIMSDLIGADDDSLDALPECCLTAPDPMESVTAVFTGEVVSTEVLSISLKDGSTFANVSAIPAPTPDQPVQEDDVLSQNALPIYGYTYDGQIYVVVTSYKVDNVHLGGVEKELVRVLGTGGLVGSREVVAVAGVLNTLNAGVEIRYDLVADYALVLTDGDLSTSNISRIIGMTSAE